MEFDQNVIDDFLAEAINDPMVSIALMEYKRIRNAMMKETIESQSGFISSRDYSKFQNNSFCALGTARDQLEVAVGEKLIAQGIPEEDAYAMRAGIGMLILEQFNQEK